MPTKTLTAVAADLSKLPDRLRAALQKEMTNQARLAAGHIVRSNLRGRGVHSLGVVDRRLSNSVRTTPAQWHGDTLEATIGTDVVYAAPHEFGSTATVSVRAHVRRAHRVQTGVRTLKSGATRATYRKVGETQVRAHTRRNNLPARAPLATGLSTYLPRLRAALDATVRKTLLQ